MNELPKLVVQTNGEAVAAALAARRKKMSESQDKAPAVATSYIAESDEEVALPEGTMTLGQLAKLRGVRPSLPATKTSLQSLAAYGVKGLRAKTA